MWRRLRERLLSTAGFVLALLWLVVAVAIVTGPLGVEPERRHLWVLALVFVAPAAVWMVLEEVVHRIKYGPQPLGRHARDQD